jgi:mRNA interferase MazF
MRLCSRPPRDGSSYAGLRQFLSWKSWSLRSHRRTAMPKPTGPGARRGKDRMVRHYVPEAGDIAWLNFDPQAGPEPGRRRPALVLTDQAYNRASGLVVVCPLTSKRKPYPFALPVAVDKVEGAVLVDHLKTVDWQVRKAAFHSKADPALLSRVRTYIAVLLRIH